MPIASSPHSPRKRPFSCSSMCVGSSKPSPTLWLCRLQRPYLLCPLSHRQIPPHRLHNPRGRVCGCSPECFCQGNPIGRLLRWYLPRGIHKSVAPEWKRRMQEL
jgi:hypothetical protein